MTNFKSLNYNEYLFQSLRENSNYDVKIIPNDSRAIIQAHKIILASASDYFYKIFKELPNSDDEVIIHVPDFNYCSINLIINFIYMGEIEISTNDLNTFLDICNLFSLKSFDRLIDNDEMIDNGTNQPTQLIDEQFSDYYKSIKSCEDIPDDLPINREGAQSSSSTQLQFDKAIEELRNGGKLNEVSLKYKIPRSTLYFRARKSSIQLRISENAYYNKYNHLNEAMNSIIKNGMSYKKAAKLYNIPATILWRHAKSLLHDERTVTNINKYKAIQELQYGNLSLRELYKKYKVSISTLYRAKKKLCMEGKLPQDCLLQSRLRATTQANINQAYAAYKNGMLQTRAAALFNIPKTTFSRFVKRMSTEDTNSSLPITDNAVVDVDCDTTDSENSFGS